ncbi:Aldehyde dehydrogenase family 1 member A3 [Purpureocillium lavendulum]|uniref:Phospho-2-dehydro-3-deoxyheptonate aldolase n=1 Tax=Purpureocillium lavendulum TaxID=1247861 RepID=A0AB34FRG0_9HYPO|nr:Aldehyde dehydrogenase family 1 member A3 [Purpureocillium lavendulum]
MLQGNYATASTHVRDQVTKMQIPTQIRHVSPVIPGPTTTAGVESSGSGLSWTSDSWRLKPAAQAVEYEDAKALEETCSYLRQLPPLVSPSEIENARAEFYHVALGRGFIIQAGDCAESFHDVRYNIIRRKVDLLRVQSKILEKALGKPTITLGRIAGQYAKPRSNPYETLPTGEVIHAFRGHNVNSEDPTDRRPDPNRLLLGYFYAAASQNTIRHLPGPALGAATKARTTSALYTSHEALHLPYESSLTRDHYNLSATTVWLGERTRQRDGAHVEYARGLRNPIGVKIGPTATPAEVVALLNVLAPDRAQHGKITIITRMGQGKVRVNLPPIIRAVQLSGHVPIWMSDPCHGNTFATKGGVKTRRVADMLLELQETYLAHKSLGSHLGGIHLEQTGEDVSECLDGNDELLEDGLGRCYRSLCDPRLSSDQAIQLVTDFAKYVKEQGA